ncbi:MAG: hypothetical protein VW270_14895, partial [Candidatus Poseidoniales archaeon]
DGQKNMTLTYNPKTQRMTYKKCPIGTIESQPDGTCRVTDVRGRDIVYPSRDDAHNHFTRFMSWDNYVRHTPIPPSRLIRKNTELRQRFALT